MTPGSWSPSAPAGKLTRGDRLAGALLGQALGDALGFVVEAEPPVAAAAYVREFLQTDRAGERHHPSFPFGQYTDDTQLARELLLSVREAGGWSPSAFAGRVAALFQDGRDVGAGPGTRGAAERLLAGASWRESGAAAPYAGNGSAMRVAPLGVLFAEDADGLRRAAGEQSRITHRDPRCA
ncbi:MAG: ADP-ribosylglycohydrolase family protein, partial [Gemmatimonadota bacterium]|nr:ADP-ribosylglycohydrolase family protein [Gemmatimonadota bacterium]